MEPTTQDAGVVGAPILSVAVIGPDGRSRDAVSAALAGSLSNSPRQLPFYPEVEQLVQVVEAKYDMVIVDLDSNPEVALEVVENLCGSSSATVMVSSASSDSELMIRSMRAGAREFLTLPISQTTMAEAVVRASARRTSVRPARKADGKLCVFWGAKGGSGVTTLATNFAISAAHEGEGKVLLIDLDLPLGDAVLNLGLTPQYSTVDALKNFARLDATFLSRLFLTHSSGLSVLAAPGTFVPTEVSTEAVDRLIAVARQEFDCVVVDSGSNYGFVGSALFDQSATMYLVSQVGIAELRNSNRLITELFPGSGPKLEIILNRYSSNALGVDEEHVTRALTRPAQWRVPEDNGATKKMQTTATPLALGDSGIAREIRKMARVACGLPPEPEKKKRLMGLF